MERAARKKAFRIIICCSAIFPAGLLATMAVSSSCAPHVILSESMEPALHVGDVVLIDRDFKHEDIKVGADGDIIVIENFSIFVNNLVPAVFYSHLDEKTPIIHRAIDKRVIEGKIYFITKGDNNPYADGCIKYKNLTDTSYSLIEVNSSDPVLVPQEWITGVVGSIVPFLGHFKIHSSTITGHIFVVFSALLIHHLWRGKKHASKEHPFHLSPDQ